MKKKIFVVLSPYYFLLNLLLKRIKYSCIGESIAIKTKLARLNFFQPVTLHPSIIFGNCPQQSANKNVGFSTLWFLKINIICGVFNNGIGRNIALANGIHPAFAYDMKRLLYGNNNDYIEYNIPKKTNTNFQKIAIYSALTGGYDNLWEPIVYPHKDIQVDYIMFTDDTSLKSTHWQIRHINDNCSPALLSRKVRMFPHTLLPEYDVCIYVDASMFIYGDIAQLANTIDEKKTLAITRHPERTTIKEEIHLFAKRVGIDSSIANKQYNLFLEKGFKDNIPLTENGMFVAKNNNNSLIELMEHWFAGYRDCLLPSDQIPLQPAMSQLNFKDYNLLEGSVWCNQFFMVMPHKKRS